MTENVSAGGEQTVNRHNINSSLTRQSACLRVKSCQIQAQKCENNIAKSFATFSTSGQVHVTSGKGDRLKW